jgi:hypothetical protein
MVMKKYKRGLNMKKVVVGVGVLLLCSGAWAHVTIQKGPNMPTMDATQQTNLRNDYGRDHVDLEPTVMGIRITTSGLNYIVGLINAALQDTTGANVDLSTSLLLKYVDCLVKGMLDADTIGSGTQWNPQSQVKWDNQTKTCNDATAYQPGILLGPTCLSIPMMGSFCLFIKVQDDPLDADTYVIEWHVNRGPSAPGGAQTGDDFPRVTLTPRTNSNKIVRAGDTDPSHDYDDSLDLSIYLADISLDVLFTFPSTATDKQKTGYQVLYDTCSSTLEDGPACLGSPSDPNTCREVDMQNNYVPEEDLSNYPTMRAKILIGCVNDTNLTGGPEDMASSLCGTAVAPVILSTSIRAWMEYDDFTTGGVSGTHINYKSGTGAADSGAWCDPDRDADNDFGAGGCHRKDLRINIAGLNLYANVYFQWQRNPNMICTTPGCYQVFGGGADPDTRFTGPSTTPTGTTVTSCCGPWGGFACPATFSAERKAFCDRNGNNVCGDMYDDPNYNPSQNIGGTLPFLEAQIMARLQDVFTCECTYGTFPGGNDGNICTPDANECIDPATGQSRAGTNASCGDEIYPASDPGCVGYYLASTLSMNLSPTLDTISFDHPLTEATDPIYIDAGIRFDLWADALGVLLPGDLGLDVYYTRNAGTPSAPNLEPMTSCVTLQHTAGGYVGPITPVVSYVCYDTRYYTQLSGSPCGTAIEFAAGVGNQDSMLYASSMTAEFKQLNYAVGTTTGTFPYHIGIAIHHNFFSRAITSIIKSGALCMVVDGNTPTIGSFLTGILNTQTFGMLMPKLQELYGDNDMQIRIVPSFKSPDPAGLDYTTLFEQAYPPTTTGPRTPIFPTSSSAEVPFVLTGGRSIVYLYNLTGTYPNFPTAFTTQTQADLTIGIPHLHLDFHVFPAGATAWGAQRVFGLDFGMLLGLDIELLRNDSKFDRWDFGGGIALTTGRVLHIGAMLSSGVNYYLEYYEALTGLSRKDLNGILSNLIPTILSMAIGLTADIGFDLGYALKLPLTFRVTDDSVCTGPGQRTCPAAAIMPVGAGRAFAPGSAITWRMPVYLLSATNSTPVMWYPTDLNWMNPPDWLGISFMLYGTLRSSIIINLLEGGLLSSLGLSPADGWDGFNPPETIIIPSEKLTAMEAGFVFDAYDDYDNGNTVRYAWRLDKGFWTPFVPQKSAVFSYLYEGNHILEVRAVDSDGNMDPTPAVYTFRIDSLGPSIRIHGAGDMNIVATSSPTFYIEARDAQAPDELVTISYRVDGSDWTPFTSARTITLSGLEEGLHRLEVRAKDDVGNISTASMVFKVSTGAAGFGCSVVKSSGLGFGLILLFVPLLFRRRS